MQRKIFVSILHILHPTAYLEIAAILHHCKNIRPNLLVGVGTVTKKKRRKAGAQCFCQQLAVRIL